MAMGKGGRIQVSNLYAVGFTTDIGIDREKQEDYVTYEELGNDALLCVVADGTGSRRNYTQPAVIAALETVGYVKYLYSYKKDLFLSDPEFFLRTSMMLSNRVLGAFKMGNEEILSGYGASVTCCLFSNGRIFLAHAGNTRLYILRGGKLRQLTRDHTKGMELYEQGLISLEDYHQHPDRLNLTSGIGIVADPEIQTLSGKLQKNDLVLMSTDGIHYALRAEAMAELILNSGWVDNASQNLVQAARDVVKYPDNMSAAVICSNEA